MEVDLQIVNAFVDGDHGGNPAGVVLGAERLDPAQKLRIAAEAGLSETAFVSPSTVAAFKLEFFTPTRQIAHCGHATIATFAYLRALGRVGDGETSKETIDGTRKIVLRDGMAYMEQLAPRYQPLADPTVAALCGLEQDDLDPDHPPTIVYTGNKFLIIAARDAATVARARPNLVGLSTLSGAHELVGVYLFSKQTEVAGRDAGARMFAPLYGIAEEAATGMAAGPLACFLHDRMAVAKDEILIEQGRLMKPPSPSLIRVDLWRTDGRITGLLAGGRAAVMQSFRISV